MKSASIIIPTFNRLDLLKRCVSSVRDFTQTPYEIIVVDNGSTDGTIEWCRQQRLPFVSFAGNRGFPAACNRGLRLSTGDTIVLLDNDTYVTPRWPDNLSAALYSSPRIGIVGPVANYAGGAQEANYPFDTMEELVRIAEEVGRSNPAQWKRTERLAGFCFAFRRELMEKIGLMDERFSPGHFEDDDYCLRARLEGYELLACRDVVIYHEGSASFRQQDQQRLLELVERNYLLFKDKWQLDPRAYN